MVVHMTKRSDGYSAQVSLMLLVNGMSLALSHVEPSEIRVRDSCVAIVDGCNAQLVITVNGRSESKSIFLPSGIRSGERARYF